MNRVGKLLTVFLGSTFSLLTYGLEVSPASFGESADEFVGKLSFPEVSEGNMLTVKCGGQISDRGTFETILCLGDSNFTGDSGVPRKAGAAIARVAKGMRIAPARVDGRRVDVWYNFAVRYEMQGGSESIQILDNHLRNESEFGTDYIAAQRYNSKTSKCASSLRSAVFVQASVSADGQVNGVNALGDGSGSCPGKLVESMQGSTYIPAHASGSPVASTYVEIFTP